MNLTTDFNQEEVMGFSHSYPTLEDINAYWSEALSEIPSNIAPVETRDRDAQPNSTIDRHSGAVWLRFEGTDGIEFWCLWLVRAAPPQKKVRHNLQNFACVTNSA